MNSHQRRKDRRLWKYSVSTDLKDYNQYVEIWDWLKRSYTSKVRKCGWRDRHPYYRYYDSFSIIWQFTDEKKLVEFLLRWS